MIRRLCVETVTVQSLALLEQKLFGETDLIQDETIQLFVYYTCVVCYAICKLQRQCSEYSKE